MTQFPGSNYDISPGYSEISPLKEAMRFENDLDLNAVESGIEELIDQTAQEIFENSSYPELGNSAALAYRSSDEESFVAERVPTGSSPGLVSTIGKRELPPSPAATSFTPLSLSPLAHSLNNSDNLSLSIKEDLTATTNSSLTDAAEVSSSSSAAASSSSAAVPAEKTLAEANKDAIAAIASGDVALATLMTKAPLLERGATPVANLFQEVRNQTAVLAEKAQMKDEDGKAAQKQLMHLLKFSLDFLEGNALPVSEKDKAALLSHMRTIADHAAASGIGYSSKILSDTAQQKLAPGPTAEVVLDQLKYLAKNYTKLQHQNTMQTLTDVVKEADKHIAQLQSRDDLNDTEKSLLEELRDVRNTIVADVAKTVSLDKFSPAEIFMALDKESIARQSLISNAEFSGQAWSKKGVQAEQAPNIAETTHFFNQLSTLVTNDVLERDNPKAAGSALDKWVKVAELAEKEGNFSVMNAIYSVCDRAAVYNNIYPKNNKPANIPLSNSTHRSIQRMRVLFDPTGSSKNYRVALAAAQANNAAVPFIGTALTDITFSDDGATNVTKEGKVNQQKMQLLSKTYDTTKIRRGKSRMDPKAKSIPAMDIVLRGTIMHTDAEYRNLSNKFKPQARA